MIEINWLAFSLLQTSRSVVVVVVVVDVVDSMDLVVVDTVWCLLELRVGVVPFLSLGFVQTTCRFYPPLAPAPVQALALSSVLSTKHTISGLCHNDVA